MTLCDLAPGQSAQIQRLAAGSALHRRLLDIGLIEGTQVECLFTSPLGDPTAFRIRGAVIALRQKDLKTIHIQA
ncbi:MAG: ferrous iron transport protein A [Clostridia bacterium]|nr:ferrous iron transport protein A [Clostridia bacterium]